MSIASRQKYKKDNKCKNRQQYFLNFGLCKCSLVCLNFPLQMGSFSKALELPPSERSCTQSLSSELAEGQKFGRCQRDRNLASASVQEFLEHGTDA